MSCSKLKTPEYTLGSEEAVYCNGSYCYDDVKNVIKKTMKSKVIDKVLAHGGGKI